MSSYGLYTYLPIVWLAEYGGEHGGVKGVGEGKPLSFNNSFVQISCPYQRILLHKLQIPANPITERVMSLMSGDEPGEKGGSTMRLNSKKPRGFMASA